MKKNTILSITMFIIMLLSALSVNSMQEQNENYATVINLENGHRKAVRIGDTDAFKGGYTLEVASGYELTEQSEDDDMLGYSVASGYKTTLSASMTKTQSTISVSSMTLPDDHTLTMADLGSKVFFTLEPSSSNKKEIVMCTGISGSIWTGCTRGLAFYGTSTASVAANREKHSAGSIIIMSNVHYVYDELMDKDTEETIAGNKTFSGTLDFTTSGTVDFLNVIPTMPTTAPTTDDQIASKSYVDGVAIAGGATSTEAIAGIGELATATEQANNTFSATDPTFLSTKYASSTTANNYVIVADADGELDNSFIGDNSYTFSGANTFSATTTMATTTITDLSIDGTDIKSNMFYKTMTAGETINGATLPVPIFIANAGTNPTTITQDTSDNVMTTSDIQENCQTFTIANPDSLSKNQKITTIQLYLDRENDPAGNFYVEIFAVDGSNKPTGSALATTNVDATTIGLDPAWNTFTFNYSFSFATTYAIVIRCPDGTGVNNIQIATETPSAYSGGQLGYNTGSGTSWTLDTKDWRFKINYTYLIGDVGEIFKCDANNSHRLNYCGFATSNGTDGNDIDIQFAGIVDGFSGLSTGYKYYASNSIGEIGTSAGDTSIFVGYAINATDITMNTY